MDNLHIYLRVSSDKQIDDGFGLESQKELGLKISKNLNLNPIIFDEGSSSSFSDSLSNRPKMRELLIEVEEGKVQNLWIYQLDRLSRNDVISFQIRQTLKNSGVTLYVGDGRKFELEKQTNRLGCPEISNKTPNGRKILHRAGKSSGVRVTKTKNE